MEIPTTSERKLTAIGKKDDLDLFKVFCFTFYHIKSPSNQNLGEYSMNFSEHLKQI